VITVAICFLFINQLVRLTEIRGSLLIPTITVFILLGAYVDAKSWFAVALTLVAGAIGYIFVRFDWPRPPLILGLVLGSLAEKNLFTSYQAYGSEMFLRPIVLAILLVGASVVGWSLIQAYRRNQKAFQTDQSPKAVWSEVPLIVSFIAVASFALLNSSRLPLSSRMFPWAISIALIVLAFAQLALTLRRLLVSSSAGHTEAPANASAPDAHSGGSLVAILLWILGLTILTVLIGFKIGSALGTLLFLRLAAGETWRTAIIGGGATYLFFLVFGDLLKLVDLDAGMLGAALGASSFESFLSQLIINCAL